MIHRVPWKQLWSQPEGTMKDKLPTSPTAQKALATPTPTRIRKREYLQRSPKLGGWSAAWRRCAGSPQSACTRADSRSARIRCARRWDRSTGSVQPGGGWVGINRTKNIGEGKDSRVQALDHFTRNLGPTQQGWGFLPRTQRQPLHHPRPLSPPGPHTQSTYFLPRVLAFGSTCTQDTWKERRRTLL